MPWRIFISLVEHIAEKLKRNLWVVLLLALLGIMCYINCLPNEMFWDEDDFILKNRYIKDWRHFPLFFTENLIAGSYLVSNYWRPLLLTLFTIEWHLWEAWPPGWHAVSIAAHIAAAAALFHLVLRLFSSRPLAIISAIIFLMHPAHNEVVVYCNSIGDSIATLFVLLGLNFYVRFRQNAEPILSSRSYYLSLLMFPLAMLSKETGFTLPPLIVVTDFLLTFQGRPIKERIIKTLSAAWPFIVMAGIYLLLRATVLNFSNTFNFYQEETAFTSNIFLRFMTFFKVMSEYCGFFFLPFDLRVERSLPLPESFFELPVLWGAFLVGGLLVIAFRNWNKQPLYTFGVLWFLICITPTSNILIPINALIYEHFLYAPMIGIVIMLCHFLIQFGAKHKLNKALLIFLIGVMIVFAGINLRRNTDWRTAVGFYEKLMKTASTSYRVVNNLGMEYSEKGMNSQAERTYEKAIAMLPNNPVAYHNIGGLYRDTGRPEEAMRAFSKALELDPGFIFSYKSLAQLYLDKKDYTTTRKLLTEYFNRTVDKPEAIELLVKVALMEKDYKSAYQYLRIAEQISPNDIRFKADRMKIEQLLNRQPKN